MRVALCFHGLADGKNSKGRKVRADLAAKSFQKNLLELNRKMGIEIDVFFHSWSVGIQDQLVEWYQPKKFMIEEQINFITDRQKNECMEKIRQNHCARMARYRMVRSKDGKEQRCVQCWKMVARGNFNQDLQKRCCDNCYWLNKLYYRNMCSLFYSFDQSNRLKSIYEKEQGFKYDLVITSRFDLYLGNPLLDLDQMNPEKIYYLGYDTKLKKYLIDHLFISSSQQIDLLCQIYQEIEKYTNQLLKYGSSNQHLNHDVIMIHFKKHGFLEKLVDIKDKIDAGAMTTAKIEWFEKKYPDLFS